MTNTQKVMDSIRNSEHFESLLNNMNIAVGSDFGSIEDVLQEIGYVVEDEVTYKHRELIGAIIGYTEPPNWTLQNLRRICDSEKATNLSFANTTWNWNDSHEALYLRGLETFFDRMYEREIAFQVYPAVGGAEPICSSK